MNYYLFFLLFSIIFTIIIIIRFKKVLILKKNEKYKNKTKKKRFNTMIVLGSGGHTAEMFRLLRGFPIKTNYTPRTYVIAKTDNHSKQKANTFEETNVEINKNNVQEEEEEGEGDYSFIVIPRSREVGQSYFSSIFTTLYSCIFSFISVFRIIPDIIICNGPGTCVPICLGGIFLKFLGIKDVQLIYIESICRVEDLSLSARLLYVFVNRLFVQWEELEEKYPKAEYYGLLSN
eukprot:TRINITY_DN369_c0_g2_i1.p1 TRINITY_DN369_c0_g2~~TRINITY_DN369_c0_g2_i1.p1  ORF type:complete len:233 (+),score=28.35 TRINITY_DN369_c0_g2_i1:41-739(+)